MQDGTRRDVELACGLIVGPVRAKVKDLTVLSDQFRRTFVDHQR